MASSHGVGPSRASPVNAYPASPPAPNIPRGTRGIFGAGGDAGYAFTGLAREGPSPWLLAIYAGARSRELFQRPGFSRAAGATAGAESHGGDSALGQLVFESGAHVEGYRTSAAAHAGADHPQRNIVCP